MSKRKPIGTMLDGPTPGEQGLYPNGAFHGDESRVASRGRRRCGVRWRRQPREPPRSDEPRLTATTATIVAELHVVSHARYNPD